jgi:hypothetical protein
LHLLGVDHHGFFADRQGRLLPVSIGEPIYKLLGNSPATQARVEPGGDIAMLPPYDPSPLVNLDFAAASPLWPVDRAESSGAPTKGWHAWPLRTPDRQADQPGALSVRLFQNGAEGSRLHLRHVAIGFGDTALGGAAENQTGTIAQGERAMLTQSVRSPRAGRYVFSIHAGAVAASKEFYQDVFLREFTFRLSIFGYTDLKKDPRHVREFASLVFAPPYLNGPDSALDRFEVRAVLRSQDAGAFETSMGVGVAVIVEKSSPGTLKMDGQSASVCLAKAGFVFDARPRDDTVKV